jgi:AcrR family transcriptional regulator
MDLASKPKPVDEIALEACERTRRDPITREQLLDAATKEFVRHGFSKANVARIIAGVGGSRRNIYKHFTDKQGLFAAVVRMLGARYATERVTPPQTADLAPAAYLTLVATEYLRAASSYEGLGLYRLAVAEGVHFPAVAETLLSSSGHQEIEGNVTAYIAPRLPGGDLARARRLADLFLGMVRGDLYLRATIDPRLPVGEDEIIAHARDAVALFLGGAGLER